MTFWIKKTSLQSLGCTHPAAFKLSDKLFLQCQIFFFSYFFFPQMPVTSVSNTAVDCCPVNELPCALAQPPERHINLDREKKKN